MDQLNVAIIGLGGMGTRRALELAKAPEVKIAAVCSRDKTKAQQFAREHGGEVFADPQTLFAQADVDAVMICTPNNLHFPLALEAVRHGKHTLVEYPMALTLEQFDTLVSEAAKAGVILHHGMTCRLEHYYLTMKAALPQIGKLLCTKDRWFGAPSCFYGDPVRRGNIWATFHIHFVDHFRGIFGEPLWVEAADLSVPEEGIWLGTMLMGFPNNTTGYIEFGHGFRVRPTFAWTILGTKGHLEFEGGRIMLHTQDGVKELTMIDQDGIAADTCNFLAQVHEGASPAIAMNDARRSLEISLAAELSARQNRRVQL